jgi:uncharacterized repeat protein (TIGR01451 family)
MLKMYFVESFQLLTRSILVFAILFVFFCLLNPSKALAQPENQSDLTVTKTAPESVQAGSNLSYTITVNNSGPDAATNAKLTDTLPSNTTFVSLTQNSGPAFSCTTPAIGASGAVTCTAATFANQASAQFTLTVNVINGAASNNQITNVATVNSSVFDSDTENNSSSATTTVRSASAASVSVSGRVLTQNGRGIRGAIVRLTDEHGQQRFVTTSPFGYYRFTDIRAGQVYIISILAKKYSFAQPEQILNLTGDMNDIVFVANN